MPDDLETLVSLITDELLGKPDKHTPARPDPYGVIDTFTADELTDPRPFVPREVYQVEELIPETGANPDVPDETNPDIIGAPDGTPAPVSHGRHESALDPIWIDDEPEAAIRPPKKLLPRL